MKTNLEIKAAAREQLRGNWGMAAVTTLIYVVVVGVANFIALIIGGPLELGYINYLRQLRNGEEAQIETLFSGFNNFVQALVAFLLMAVLVAVGFFLLIVPGIILAFGLSMTFFILSDDKEIDAVDAMKRSWAIMRGHKWGLFCLWLRFIGWWLLVIVTLGVAALWAYPYFYLAMTNFYDEIKVGTPTAV